MNPLAYYARGCLYARPLLVVVTRDVVEDHYRMTLRQCEK